MTTEALLTYCLAKHAACQDLPFGPVPICTKVGGRIFAQIYPNPLDFKVTLKCDPPLADHLRSAYPDTVLPGYHCPPVQRPFWNTVYLNRDVPDVEILQMVDHAYAQVIKKLPPAMRAQFLQHI